MRPFSRKSKFLAGFILVLICFWVWFQIYLNQDYRHHFLKNKGGVAEVTENFKSEDSLFFNYEVRVQDSNGLTITCLVRSPKDKSRRHPGLLVMNGFDTGKDVISIFRSTEEAVLISFDWPYAGKRKFKGADIGLFLPRIRHAIIRSVSVVLTVIDYLASREDVDAEKIFVVGASFGAPFAVNAAAVDPRIKAVILLYGGGDIAKLVESSSTKQVKTAWGRKLLGWFVAALLAPVEPLKYVEYIAPRPLLMINGRHDQSIFEESAELLFEQAHEPKEMIWLETQHAKPKMTDLTYQLEEMMKNWLLKKGML
jgi:hypothetical protein